jgi:hypothetical protein
MREHKSYIEVDPELEVGIEIIKKEDTTKMEERSTSMHKPTMPFQDNLEEWT